MYFFVSSIAHFTRVVKNFLSTVGRKRRYASRSFSLCIMHYALRIVHCALESSTKEIFPRLYKTAALGGKYKRTYQGKQQIQNSTKEKFYVGKF